MMRAFVVTLVASLLLATASCQQETPTSVDPAVIAAVGDVEVAGTTEGVRLTNRTDQPVAYTVWARGFLGLFAPCVDVSPGCLRLSVGASVVVPVAEIVGIWPDEREAIVYWWHVVPDGAGGYRVDEVREVAVAL